MVGQFGSVPTPLYTVSFSRCYWLQPGGPVDAEDGDLLYHLSQLFP